MRTTNGFRRLVVEAPVRICRFRPDGELVFANTAFLNSCAKPNPSLSGHNFFESISEEGRLRVQHHLEALTPEAPTVVCDFNGIGAGSQPHRQQYHIRAVFDVKGVVVEYQAFSSDRHYEDQTPDDTETLQRQLEHAQKMQAIGTLAGGMAHEFNNLLQIIQGYSELLLYDNEELNGGKEELHGILESAKKGAALSNQLLTFSRNAKSDLRRTGLNDCITHVRKLLAHTIPKMVTVELDLDDQLWPITADPNHIEQVLLNLALNAKDAMPNGGRLRIATQNVRIDRSNPKLFLSVGPGKKVWMTVTDTGCGMDNETVSHIYEPFFTTKETGQGSGLGLAIVYGIVENHGGHIICDSKPGRGTTFNIFFPALTKAESRTPSTVEAHQAEESSKKILVVDDEDFIRDIVAKTLSKYGYDVAAAEDGHEALNAYQQANNGNRFDLVILDLNMPGMGGMECLDQLLKLDPDVNVIISSGYSQESLQDDALAKRVRGFIQKPYQVAKLIDTVAVALQKG